MAKETKSKSDEEDDGGLDSAVDKTVFDPSCKESEEDSDIEEIIEEIIEVAEDSSEIVADDKRKESSTGSYSADCYSFMAIHGPFDKNLYFYFGFMVWLFQVRPLLFNERNSFVYCENHRLMSHK